MKKIPVIVILCLLLLLLGCNQEVDLVDESVDTVITNVSEIETTVSNMFDGYDIPEEWIERYEIGFEDFFSVEDYLLVCDIVKELSATPFEAVSKNLFLVKQDLSTYDKIDQKALLLNTSGEILQEYEDENESVYSISAPYHYSVGEYFVIGSTVCDSDGKYVGTYDIMNRSLKKIVDLGKDYYLFAPGPGLEYGESISYALYLMDPKGTCYYLDVSVHDLPYQMDEISVGKLSDGYFSILYEHLTDETYAYYFDTAGKKCIDLSSRKIDYEVFELGKFKDGKAKIKFVGIDHRNYCVDIDKAGNFISEPILDK